MGTHPAGLLLPPAVFTGCCSPRAAPQPARTARGVERGGARTWSCRTHRGDARRRRRSAFGCARPFS